MPDVLMPAALFLGAAVTLAVLKSPIHPLGSVTAPERLTPATVQPVWHPSVPLAERFEAVTVLDRERTIRIVEIFGARREVLFDVAVAS